MSKQILFESLSETKASALLKEVGHNQLPQAQEENFLSRMAKMFKEPMLLLLFAASLIYFIVGDLNEALMLVASVFVVLGISYYQERKSEKALAALKELSSPRALVIRDREEKRIPAHFLVPGDLVVLSEGDRVPADGVILQSTNLSIDESLLTGESFPAKKSLQENENQNKVFSSTLVVSGTAFIRVSQTGLHTEVGKIGKSLQEAEPDQLNLAKEIRQMVQLFAWSGAFLCLTIIILYGLTRGVWTEAFLVGLATQMSLLPEEFPVVLTIFLAMGAWRLSKLQVLVRKPGSIERLGAVTILCVDKTGTLTKNQMTVTRLNNGTGSVNLNSETAKTLPEDYHQVAEYGVLASHKDPFDPMEKAIRRMLEDFTWGREHLHQDWELVRDYPLSDKLLAMSCVWKNPQQETYVIASKGAPEAIIDLCHLETAHSQIIINTVKEMAAQGLRVLGVAKASFAQSSLPSDQHDFPFQWVGLIGLQDPLRPEVPGAIELCRQAGVRVIMMTGDYPETALAIAKQAGIETEHALLTGADVKTLSDSELHARLKTAHIFARMIPEQKLRIVKILKDLGHVVAMTGDGVNDAPSLKWADVGIAMGARGTDVAREASDIVLLDDNFASIVAGIERGRIIFSNIRKAMSYIVAIHVPIAALSILPVLLKWPLILYPIHIVFLELIIDPACSLMFESQSPDKDMMQVPPRSLKERLFSLRDLLRSFLQGSLVAAIAFSIVWQDPHARAYSFVVLALCNLGLIFANMTQGSWAQMKDLVKKISNIAIAFAVTGLLLLTTQVPTLRTLFSFEPLPLTKFASAIFIALAIFTFISLWNWLIKRWQKK